MNRKTILFALLILLVSEGCSAKSMSDIWRSMPDSILPFVDANHRLEMIEFIGMNLKGDVDNQLGGKSVMYTITYNYIHVSASPSSTLELRKLPTDGDSIICMVKTFDDSDSEISFYTMDWEKLSAVEKSQNEILSQELASIAAKEKESQDSSLLTDIGMLKLRLFVDKDELELSYSSPLMAFGDDKYAENDATTNKPDEHRLKLICLKWDGSTFK